MAQSFLSRLLSFGRGSPAASRRFGAYHIVKIIHEGEKAFVYQARSAEDDSLYAIKAYQPGYNRTARRMRKRYHLRNEGEIGMMLNAPAGTPPEEHPIVRTVAHGREFGALDGPYYIVQEYVDGYNMKTLLGCDQPMTRTERLKIALTVARGLAFIHDKGMIHRDICMDNILVTREGRAKLIDLGFAAPIGFSFEEKSGTPSYMSPEQCMARPLNPASDIYSFGIVLFELFTNRLPFTSPYQADTPELTMRRASDLMLQHLRKTPPKPTEFAADIPPALEAFILRCMEKSPEKRPATMRHVIVELTQAVETEAKA